MGNPTHGARRRGRRPSSHELERRIGEPADCRTRPRCLGARRPSRARLSRSRRRAFGRTRWSSDLIDDIVEHPATIWGVQPVMAALQRGRVKRIVIADDLDANTADRLIRHAVASAAELTLADAGALGPLGVAARPRG
jgi:hypothetical protein